MQAENRQTVFSGIQPSGIFTLGNYLGAVRHWAPLQQSYHCLYSVVNLHAITVRQSPAALRQASLQAAAMLLASGINPKTGIVFVQSGVPQHAQLAWLLACNTPYGQLLRMTQFKDKSKKHAQDINAGLFTYPILMAADILLYNANYVPVGADQKQHVELCRDIAQRFNSIYPGSFALPQPLIQKEGARVMSLQDPAAKMSKSDENPNSYIAMTDSPSEILRKCKKAVTDSEGQVRRDEVNKPGVANLMSIYGAMRQKSDAEIEKEFAGQGYGVFKQAVAQSITDVFTPIQGEYTRILADIPQLEKTLAQGAQKAQEIAQKCLDKVYTAMGI